MSGVRFADESPNIAVSRRHSDSHEPLEKPAAPARSFSQEDGGTVSRSSSGGIQQWQLGPAAVHRQDSGGTGEISHVSNESDSRRNLRHTGSGGSDLVPEGRSSSGDGALHDADVEPVRRPSRRTIVVKHIGGHRRGASQLDHGGGSGGGHDSGGNSARDTEGRRSPERSLSGSGGLGERHCCTLDPAKPCTVHVLQSLLVHLADTH